MDDLRKDRPTAAELLEIVADTLKDTVVPATASHAQHQARVAANLCQILARELDRPEGPEISLPASLIDATEDEAANAYREVVELVRTKLAVNKPGYDTHGVAEERSIVA